jgi:hypothetical protein
MRLGSLAVRTVYRAAGRGSYDCGGRQQLIPGRADVRIERRINPRQWERDGIGPAVDGGAWTQLQGKASEYSELLGAGMTLGDYRSRQTGRLAGLSMVKHALKGWHYDR